MNLDLIEFTLAPPETPKPFELFTLHGVADSDTLADLREFYTRKWAYTIWKINPI